MDMKVGTLRRKPPGSGITDALKYNVHNTQRVTLLYPILYARGYGIQGIQRDTDVNMHSGCKLRTHLTSLIRKRPTTNQSLEV
jgi:hypothetical protein